MNNDFLFPQAQRVIDEAAERHAGVLPFVLEAIDLGHLAYARERDFSATLVPGVPCTRRARNDVNDNAWRFLRAIAEPLIAEGLIRDLKIEEGGDVMVLPDNLHVRLKKGGPDGSTSNFPTGRISKMGTAAIRYALYPEAIELDIYIEEGLWLDVVYVAGESMSEYRHVGLRFAMAKASPFVILDPPTEEQLTSISPTAFELVVDARDQLAG